MPPASVFTCHNQRTASGQVCPCFFHLQQGLQRALSDCIIEPQRNIARYHELPCSWEEGKKSGPVSAEEALAGLFFWPTQRSATNAHTNPPA
jgi:hypothetical protein